MDEQPEFWTGIMGALTALVPLIYIMYLFRATALKEVVDIFVSFLVMAALAAPVWWILIERRQKLQYYRGVVYVTSVIILWGVALGAIDLVRENGVQVGLADIADQLGVIAFGLFFGLFFLTPFILAGGVVLVFIRRYFDDNYHVIPGR